MGAASSVEREYEYENGEDQDDDWLCGGCYGCSRNVEKMQRGDYSFIAPAPEIPSVLSGTNRLRNLIKTSDEESVARFLEIEHSRADRPAYDLFDVDLEGNAMLHTAAGVGSRAICKLLLARGAVPARNKHRQLPSEVADLHGTAKHRACSLLLRHVEHLQSAQLKMQRLVAPRDGATDAERSVRAEWLKTKNEQGRWLNRFIMLSEDSLDVFDRFHGPDGREPEPVLPMSAESFRRRGERPPEAPIHHAVHAGGELCRAWAGRKVQGRWEFVVQGAGAREPTHISAQTEKERLSWLRSINQVKKRAVLRRGSGVARAESAEEAASPPHVASRGAPVRSERVGAFHWSNEVEDGSADAQRGAVPGEKAVQRAAGESSAGESSAGIPSLQKLVSSKQLAEDTAPQTAMA